MLKYNDIDKLLENLALDTKKDFDNEMKYTNVWDFGKVIDNTRSGMCVEVNQTAFNSLFDINANYKN